ncbi:zinc finger protein Xfin-like [Palaemon carinicauda]|uniref:zinc finger protein Xfin-like n=1 Tax=Palaemon carinicauda TaxID=392227 RepID=UPI0035B5E02A
MPRKSSLSARAKLRRKRLQMRQKRANESQEMRMKRLSQNRQKSAERRAKEPLEDRLNRLSRMRQQVARKRLTEKRKQQELLKRLSQAKQPDAEKGTKEQLEGHLNRPSHIRQQVARNRLKEKQKQQELRLSQDAKSRASQNYAACIIPTEQGNGNAVLRGKRGRGVGEKRRLMEKKDMEHYVCALCDISFEDVSTLYLHMKIHINCVVSESSYFNITPRSCILSRGKDSDDKYYWCNICRKRFRTFHFFTRHMQAHREGKTFQCKICARIFTSKSILYNHICQHVTKMSCKCTSGHHGSQGKDDQPKIFESADDLHLCFMCYMGFDTKKQLGNHLRKHSVYLRCSLTSSSRESQVEHIEQVEDHAHVQCEICFEMFHNKEKRDDHMKIHSHSSPQKVMNDQRNVPITSASNTVRFMNYGADDLEEIISKKLKEELEKTNEELVSVSAIMVGSKTVGSLLSKDSIPGKKRNFLRDALKTLDVSNGRVGEGNKEKQNHFTCRNIVNTSGVPDIGIEMVISNEEYSETVTDSDNNHNLKYTGAKSRKYECRLCFSVWTNKRFFWQHLLGHSENVPYTCKICAEIFNEKSWEIHEESTCKCAACGRLVKGKAQSIHPKLCRIGNPFTCTLCVKRFPTTEVFSDHMKTHSRETSFACKCGNEFCNHEPDLQEEMQRKENKDPIPMLSPAEEEDDFLSDTPSEEIISQISDEESTSNVKMSSVKTESGFDLITLEPFEDRQFLNDNTATTDIEQCNFIVMTDETDSYIPDESAIDPLAVCYLLILIKSSNNRCSFKLEYIVNKGQNITSDYKEDSIMPDLYLVDGVVVRRVTSSAYPTSFFSMPDHISWAYNMKKTIMPRRKGSLPMSAKLQQKSSNEKKKEMLLKRLSQGKQKAKLQQKSSNEKKKEMLLKRLSQGKQKAKLQQKSSNEKKKEMLLKRLSPGKQKAAERRAKVLEDHRNRLSRMKQREARKRLTERQKQQELLKRLSQAKRPDAEKRTKEQLEDHLNRPSGVRQQVARERLKEKQNQQVPRLSQDETSRASQNHAACIIPTDQGNNNADLHSKWGRGVRVKQRLMEKKDLDEYICNLCDISFEDVTTFYLHMKIHINVDCAGSERTPKTSILSEGKKTNDKREHWCNLCFKRFFTTHAFTRHMQAHRDGKTFRCKICPRSFTSKSSRSAHTCQYVTETSGRCNGGHHASQGLDDQPKIVETVMCNEEYSETVTDSDNNDNLKYIGAESRKYQCRLCLGVWTNKRLFWQHLLGHSAKVPYTCKVCAEIFNKKSWKIHEESTCKCVACGKLIKVKAESIHPKLCKVGNPFTCTLCVKRFPTTEVFSDHMKTHSREKSFACKCGNEICNHETDLQKEMHRKENKDPSPTLIPTEDEDDILSDTPSEEIISLISDEESTSNVKMSSVKTGSGFDFNKLKPFVVVNEDRQFLNNSTATTDEEQCDFIVMSDETDSYIQNESAIDPLA